MCRCLQPCLTLEIVPSPSGVVIASSEDVYTVKSYAQVYITLQSPQPDVMTQWLRISRRLKQAAEQSAHKLKFGEYQKNLLYKQVDALERMFDEYRHQIVRQNTTRQKRGVFDFIGDAASSLFGIPSASDVNALKEANQRIADQVDGVVATQRKVIGRVNALGRAQARIVQDLNQVHACITDQYLLAQDTRRELLKLSNFVWFEAQISELRHRINRYIRYLDQIKTIRAACESNSHSEVTVPPRILRDIMQLAYPGPSGEVMGYYQYLSTDKIMQLDGIIYCVVKVPIAQETPQVKYQINTFPVCEEGQCVRIFQDAEIIFNQKNGDLYYPDECFGYAPHLCQTGVLYASHTQPCLHGLITRDPDQQRKCPISVTTNNRVPLPVQTKVINRYIVESCDVTYHYRCPGKNPVVGKLVRGVYVITVDPQCEMDGGQWMLVGKQVKTIHLAKVVPPPVPIDMNFMAPNMTLPKIPPGMTEMKYENFDDLSAPAQTSLHETVADLQAQIGKASWTWLWVLIGIAGAIGIGLLALKLYVIGQRRRTRNVLTEHVPLTTPPSAELKASAPPHDLQVVYVKDQDDVTLYPQRELAHARNEFGGDTKE